MILNHILVVVTLWLLIVFLLERLFAHYQSVKPKSKGILHNRQVTNIVLGGMDKILLPLLTVPILIFATTLEPWHRSVHSGLVSAILIFLDVMVLDLASYFFHRICHRFKFFWKFHEIHHLDEALDATTGLRVHFGELFFATLFRVPLIIFLAIPIKSILIFELVLAMNGIFHHSNTKLPAFLSRILSAILVTPRWHYIHHHAIPGDTNSNYGFIFIWWDFIFGTINKKRREADWVLGLKYSRDKSLIKLIYYPFTKKFLRNI